MHWATWSPARSSRRAVEPGAGEIGPDGRTHETHCLNCKTELIGDFCHACGQHAHVRRTLTSLIHDFLHGLLQLRREDLAHPSAARLEAGRAYPPLYRGPARDLRLADRAVPVQRVPDVRGGRNDQCRQRSRRRSRSSRTLPNKSRRTGSGWRGSSETGQPPSRPGRPTQRIDNKIADVKAELTAIKAVKDKGIPAAQFHFDENDQAPRWLSQSVEAAAKNPDLTFYKLQNNASKFSWLIIPLSVPFVWLLFPVQPPLPALRPHGVRHLLALLHELAGRRGHLVPVGRPDHSGRAAVADPALPHLSAAQGCLRP